MVGSQVVNYVLEPEFLGYYINPYILIHKLFESGKFAYLVKILCHQHSFNLCHDLC